MCVQLCCVHYCNCKSLNCSAHPHTHLRLLARERREQDEQQQPCTVSLMAQSASASSSAFCFRSPHATEIYFFRSCCTTTYSTIYTLAKHTQCCKPSAWLCLCALKAQTNIIHQQQNKCIFCFSPRFPLIEMEIFAHDLSSSCCSFFWIGRPNQAFLFLLVLTMSAFVIRPLPMSLLNFSVLWISAE